MAKSEGGLVRPGDILQAVQLLTRLPVATNGTERQAEAAWAYPLAGLAVGVIGAATGALAHAVGLPAPLCALLALLALVMVTGGLHEDGLADTADGLWGGCTVERRLEIMKDSRIGSYGVLALVFGVGARWAALWLLFEAGMGVAMAGIVTGAVLSRAMVPLVMATTPHARKDGLSAHVGSARPITALLALGVGVGVAVLCVGWGAFALCLWALVATAGIAGLARIKIGGQTGDILGAVQQISEIAILFYLVAG